jgi:hypothetical protein
MAKKLSLLVLALAVTAIALPVAANAAKVTSSAGKLTPVGTTLNATGSDPIFTSSLLGAITCETLNLRVVLTKNDGTTFEGSSSVEQPAASGCKFGASTIRITSIQITKLVAGPTGGSMSFVMTTDFEGVSSFECTFTGTNVPFTYTAGSDTIVFSSAGGIAGSPAGCATTKLDGAFTLEVGAAPVILD